MAPMARGAHQSCLHSQALSSFVALLLLHSTPCVSSKMLRQNYSRTWQTIGFNSGRGPECPMLVCWEHTGGCLIKHSDEHL